MPPTIRSQFKQIIDDAKQSVIRQMEELVHREIDCRAGQLLQLFETEFGKRDSSVLTDDKSLFGLNQSTIPQNGSDFQHQRTTGTGFIFFRRSV